MYFFQIILLLSCYIYVMMLCMHVTSQCYKSRASRLEYILIRAEYIIVSAIFLFYCALFKIVLAYCYAYLLFLLMLLGIMLSELLSAHQLLFTGTNSKPQPNNNPFPCLSVGGSFYNQKLFIVLSAKFEAWYQEWQLTNQLHNLKPFRKDDIPTNKRNTSSHPNK